MDIQQKNQHWNHVFERQQSAGLSNVQFCRDNKINISTFYTWRNRLASQTKKTQPQQIIPFVIKEQSFSQSSMIKPVIAGILQGSLLPVPLYQAQKASTCPYLQY
jgi:hypothetical protein